MSTAPFILLVNPWIYDFAAYDLWSKPLGLLYIAALLKHNGFDVHLIDCLDPLHPRVHELPGVKLPTRKSTGKGQFYNHQAPKPDAFKSIINIDATNAMEYLPNYLKRRYLLYQNRECSSCDINDDLLVSGGF